MTPITYFFKLTPATEIDPTGSITSWPQETSLGSVSVCRAWHSSKKVENTRGSHCPHQEVLGRYVESYTCENVTVIYRARKYGLYVVWWNLYLLLFSAQEQISPNHVQAIMSGSVLTTGKMYLLIIYIYYAICGVLESTLRTVLT